MGHEKEISVTSGKQVWHSSDFRVRTELPFRRQPPAAWAEIGCRMLCNIPAGIR